MFTIKKEKFQKKIFFRNSGSGFSSGFYIFRIFRIFRIRSVYGPFLSKNFWIISNGWFMKGLSPVWNVNTCQRIVRHRRTLYGRIVSLYSGIKRASLHSRWGAPVFIAAIFLRSRTTTLISFSQGSDQVRKVCLNYNLWTMCLFWLCPIQHIQLSCHCIL